MKVYAKKTVEQEYLKATLCDKCGSEIKNGVYSAFECQLTINRGEYLPEGRIGEVVSMDLCEPCTEGLEALLSKNGYQLHEEDAS